MNLSTTIFAVVLGVIGIAAVLRPERLLVFWTIALLVFPLARYRVSEAPFYIYDLIMLVILAVFCLRNFHRLWPVTIPRWHWWMIGTAFAISIVVGFIQDGFSAPAIWIWGHSTLAWAAFAIGALAASFPETEALKKNLRLGILISSCALAPIALIQYLDLPSASSLMQFFYGSIGADESVDRLRIGVISNRAPGPHFAPTAFGGVVLLALAIFWLVSRDEHRWQRWVVLGCSSVVILCTVSRHVIVAALLGLFAVFVLGENRARLRIVASIGIASLALLIIAPGLGLTQSWENRTRRLEGGVLNDENITARVLHGPMRLIRFIERNPATLLTGTGLEGRRTVVRNTHTDVENTGFVSNSFLLPLYYLGIPGLLIYSLFWIWATRRAFGLPRSLRAIPCGAILAALILIVSDNYAFVYEPAVALLFLIPGLIAGRGHAHLMEQLSPLDEPDVAPVLSPTAEPINAT